jgi:hypothetical protein
MKMLPLLLLLLLPRLALAETTLGTAITALPAKITKAGVYHLTKDLAYTPTSGAAIEIETTDVIIDLNAHEILGVSGSTGVYASDQSRIVIKNGTIRGFQVGVNLTANNSVVTGILATNNFEVGITVTGNNIQISNNRVCNTGGNSTYLYAIGISLTGTYGTIENNDIQNTFATDNSNHYGNAIRIKDCSNVILNANRILDVEPAAPVRATSTGIETLTSDTLIFLGNTVATTQTAFDLSGASSGKYGDNITENITTDYNTTSSGMVSIGNNN